MSNWIYLLQWLTFNHLLYCRADPFVHIFLIIIKNCFFSTTDCKEAQVLKILYGEVKKLSDLGIVLGVNFLRRVVNICGE